MTFDLKKCIIIMVVRLKKIFVVLLLILLFPINIEAKTLADMRKELKKMEAALEKAKEEQKLNEQQIINLTIEINDIAEEVQKTRADIEVANKKIELNEAEIVKKDAETKNLLKYLQVSSSENIYLEYLFEATSYTDFIYRYAIVEQLSKYNDNLMEELRVIIDNLEKAKVELAKKKSDLEVKQTNYENKIIELRANATTLKEEGTSLEDDIKDLKEEIKDYEDLGCSENIDVRLCKSVPNANGFSYPLLSGWVSSPYTPYRPPVYDGNVMVSPGSAHYAVDLAAGEGTPVYSTAAGIVRRIIRTNCGGNQVFIEHNVKGQIYTTVYMHLLSVKVVKDQIVTDLTVIGTVGGYSTSYLRGGYDQCTNGAHLHFGMAYGSVSFGGFNANSFDPALKLDFSRGRFSR